jgi:flagellar biogenesis protein FliO
VHLEDLHCLLAYFPSLICHYSVSKIIKNNKKKKFVIFFLSLFFLLAIILFCVFTCKFYFVISVLGLVLHAFT